MANTYSNLLYHVIFSTKGRAPLVSAEWKQELYRYIGGIVTTEKGLLLEIGGVSDHVHLVLKLKTDKVLSSMVMHIKGGSSKWLNEKLNNKARFAWQDGYGAFTISESQLSRAQNYIRGQEVHHQKKTFQEEFLDFLKANHVEYNEQYLWS